MNDPPGTHRDVPPWGRRPGAGWRGARLQETVETPETEEIDEVATAVGPPWMTILYNCDCHTFDQVVQQLMKAIGCSEERGWELAWEVHNTGKAVVKVGAEAECVRAGNILASIGLIVTVLQA